MTQLKTIKNHCFHSMAYVHFIIILIAHVNDQTRRTKSHFSIINNCGSFEKTENILLNMREEDKTVVFVLENLTTE